MQAAPTYKDVSRIFATRCYGCHVAAVRMGTLDLQTYEGLKQGGNHGQIVVPGKSEASRLYLMIAGKAAPAMPMDGSTLDPMEIETIRGWIDAGAPGPIASQIFDLAFSADGKWLALAGFGEVRLLSRDRQEAVLGGLSDAVRAVTFSKDGSLLAAAGGLPAREGEVLIFDVRERKIIHTIKGHSDRIGGIAFSPDGKTIATASDDKLIKLWDIGGKKEIRTYKGHTGSVYAVAFTPDDKYLVSGSADGTVKVWNPGTGECLYTLPDSLGGINAVAIDPSGKLVAASGVDKTIRIWSLGERSGKLLKSRIAQEDAIVRLAWSPDGKELVSTSADKTVKVFKANDLTELGSLSESDYINGLRFVPESRSQ